MSKKLGNIIIWFLINLNRVIHFKGFIMTIGLQKTNYIFLNRKLWLLDATITRMGIHHIPMEELIICPTSLQPDI